jgi:hypothetical protein
MAIRFKRRFSVHFDLLEERSLLSRTTIASALVARPEAKPAPKALVGSIQGTEYYPVSAPVIDLSATGDVVPMGNVTASGMLQLTKTGAVNSHGTLTLENSQGTVTLAMTKGKGYRLLKGPYFEGIPVSVRVASATGAYKAIRVSGTMTLANGSTLHHVGSPILTSLSVQLNLKPIR